MKTIEEKAIRLVLDDRVTIKWRNDDYTAGDGMVKGDSALYRAGFSPEGRWCTCPAGSHGRDCSHSIALELMVKAIEADLDMSPVKADRTIIDALLDPSDTTTYTVIIERRHS